MNIKPLLLHQKFYFLGLCLLAVGMPVSLFLTSISQFVLAAAFLFEGKLLNKFKRFFSNKSALLIAGIWLIHFIGLWNTTDMQQAFNDLRVKLPLLTLTIIVAGSAPLQKNQFHFVLSLFVFSVFCGTAVSMAVLTGIIPKTIYDIREIFILGVSNIRFSLFICVSICVLIYVLFIEKKTISNSFKFLIITLITWFLIFLIIAESATGLLILVCLLLITLFYFFYINRTKWVGWIVLSIAFLIPITLIYLCNSINKIHFKNKNEIINQSLTTANGNTYQFFPEEKQLENGYKIWAYLNETEMRNAWNSRSTIAYDSLDNKKQQLKYTLIRFLTSKGNYKDSVGVYRLTASEIKAIENGVANVNYQNISSLRARILKIMYELHSYYNGYNVNGFSVGMRFEFWKTGISIFKKNIFTGVGTGDLQTAFNNEYKVLNSSLSKQNQLRSHNQYLSIAIALGIFGFIFFLTALFYPLTQKNNFNFLYLSFFVILALSMTTEDTLETQAGATFFAFFSGLFLFRK